MMFCLVRRNPTGTARYAAEITSLVQATWGTLNLQAIQGFQSFYGLVSHDDDRVASASFYSNAGAARAANTVIDVWVRAHARQLLPAQPDVFLSKCFVHGAMGRHGTAAYGAIRAWRAAGNDLTVERVRQCLTGAVGDGFRGSCGFLDEGSGSLIAVTLSATRDPARHGHGLPGGTLWTTTGEVEVVARSWEDLSRGFW
jgi:hypothetical protein